MAYTIIVADLYNQILEEAIRDNKAKHYNKAYYVDSIKEILDQINIPLTYQTIEKYTRFGLKIRKPNLCDKIKGFYYEMKPKYSEDEIIEYINLITDLPREYINYVINKL